MPAAPGLVRLDCGVQPYAWGERARPGRPAPFIAWLRHEAPVPGRTYAELWIGAHPDLPAKVAGEGGGAEPLDRWLAAAPAARLGPAAASLGGGRLPFLLKVLSCERALSIQAHPDARLAAELHRRDPQHYPDPCAKPEIALALSPFHALVGFRPVRAIHQELRRLPALARFLAPARAGRPWLQAAYERTFRASQAEVDAALAGLQDGIRRTHARTPWDGWFLELCEQYPRDRGALSIYFLNLVELSPGEAVYLGPGVPHAYLRGTIVECMANSNNVVRAGLTGKHIDVDVLLRLVRARGAAPKRLAPRHGAQGQLCYVPPLREFRIERWPLSPGQPVRIVGEGSGSVCLLLAGAARLRCGGVEASAERGSAWFWTAAAPALELCALEPGTDLIRALPNLGANAASPRTAAALPRGGRAPTHRQRNG